jgi:hypothetical protein
MAPPARASGGEVGEIQAVVDDGHAFGVVTAETDDSNGGPELWTADDATAWRKPIVLPIGGDVLAVSQSPYGYLVVGARRKTRGRALFLGFDGQIHVFVDGVNDGAPLLASVCGAGREAWAAGAGFVLAFDRTSARAEEIDMVGAPVAMGLDLVGVPWLLTDRQVLRRHVEGTTAAWRGHHLGEGEPPFVAMGFAPDGVRAFDSRGAGVHLVPHDIEAWRARSTPGPVP